MTEVVKAYAAYTPTTPLKPFEVTRRDAGPHDVKIDLLFCGICHSDLHMARDEWGGSSIFPMVPGHEMVGRVVEVGAHVQKFKIGDLVGVGCMADSCGHCEDCKEGEEQYCDEVVFSYNGPDKISGGVTYGGYSAGVVIDEKFVLRIPDNLDPAQAAPLLCAGITTYSPLHHWKVGKGQKVGIIGLGGLGHMGVKFAHALGAHTVLFTTSESKKADALRLGADEVVISKNKEEMEKHLNSFHFILDTVAAKHDLNEYLNLLKRDGVLCLNGIPEKPFEALNAFGFILKRRSLVGSLIGGIRETQEMLDFAGKHNITADIEMIKPDEINHAYERMLKSDVRYRFVMDLAPLKK